MNKLNLPDVNYHLNSATIKNRISTIPKMLESGANILSIHPEDAMTMMPTHTPLKASTATGALRESTVEARLTFQHILLVPWVCGTFPAQHHNVHELRTGTPDQINSPKQNGR